MAVLSPSALDPGGGALRAVDEASALASPFERKTFEQRRELLDQYGHRTE